MSMQLKITGTRAMLDAMRKAPNQAERGVKNGIDQVLDDWRLEAVAIAPYDTGTLQKNITTINASGQFPGVVQGMITANAVKGGFNYAYYIHEEKKRAVTGEPQFLRVPLKENEARWQRMIEGAVEREIGRW